MSAMSGQPEILRLYRLFSDARPPERADRAAGGTLPTRGFRYCDALTSASGFGWYGFAPITFHLLWDGEDVFWTCDELDGWSLLDSAQLPGMTDAFDAAAPPDIAGYSPPFLTALAEPGMVQVWTGLLARTAPGWSLHVRAPANFPRPGGFAQYEGIVETDRWFGPVFTNLRLTRTELPVTFHADQPLVQMQALPQGALAETIQNATGLVDSPDGLAAEDWQDYTDTIVAPSRDQGRRIGSYAAEARRRRRGTCPFAGGAVSFS